jgi:hypothetical protein
MEGWLDVKGGCLQILIFLGNEPGGFVLVGGELKHGS